MDEKMSLEIAVQVLTERVGNALDDMKEMKGQLTAVNQSLIVVSAIQERIANVDKKASDIANGQDALEHRVASLEGHTKLSSMMWKIVGAVAIAALGGTGWWLSQLKDYYNLFPRVAALESSREVQR